MIASVKLPPSELQLADAFGDVAGAGLELLQLVVGQLELDDFLDAFASELDRNADELPLDTVLAGAIRGHGRMRFSSRTMLWTICATAAEGRSRRCLFAKLDDFRAAVAVR